MDCPGKAQALAVEDGKILAVGELEEVEPWPRAPAGWTWRAGPAARLCGRPQPHHGPGPRLWGCAQLSGCGSLEEMGRRMKAFRERWAIPAGEWVIGFGYDPNDLREGRHPTKGELDAAPAGLPGHGHPRLWAHGGGQFPGAAKAGVTAGTPDPEGGKIGRLEGGSPSGYLEEAAFTTMGSRIPRDPEAGLKNLERAQQVYFSQGIATIHEGLARQPEWDLLSSAAAKGAAAGGRGLPTWTFRTAPPCWRSTGTTWGSTAAG